MFHTLPNTRTHTPHAPPLRYLLHSRSTHGASYTAVCTAPPCALIHSFSGSPEQTACTSTTIPLDMRGEGLNASPLKIRCARARTSTGLAQTGQAGFLGLFGQQRAPGKTLCLGAGVATFSWCCNQIATTTVARVATVYFRQNATYLLPLFWRGALQQTAPSRHNIASLRL